MRMLSVFAAGILGCLITGPGAVAQSYPVKPVRVIVPFAPGGGSDITARRMSHKLQAAVRPGQ